MQTIPQSPKDCKNHLLSLLPPDEYASLLPSLEWVPTPLKTILHERGKPIEFAYFPFSGAHSILAIMENGDAVEVGTIGNEGFSTVDLLTGNEIATETNICQIPGESLRMPTRDFQRAISEDTALRRLCLHYLQAYLTQVSQAVACNRLHTIEQRFARWVLMSHDRVPGDEFQITQEFLADMLGVHRPSLSVVAQAYQQAGMIKYSRGNMSILDRPGLEKSCCECYRVVREQFKRYIGKAVG